MELIELPEEILLYIIGKLSLNALAALIKTCSLLCRLTKDETIWKGWMLHDFPIVQKYDKQESWYHFYGRYIRYRTAKIDRAMALGCPECKSPMVDRISAHYFSCRNCLVQYKTCQNCYDGGLRAVMCKLVLLPRRCNHGYVFEDGFKYHKNFLFSQSIIGTRVWRFNGVVKCTKYCKCMGVKEGYCGCPDKAPEQLNVIDVLRGESLKADPFTLKTRNSFHTKKICCPIELEYIRLEMSGIKNDITPDMPLKKIDYYQRPDRFEQGPAPEILTVWICSRCKFTHVVSKSIR